MSVHVRELRIDVPGFGLGPLSFDVENGQALLVFGPSRAGKTALLKALVGFAPARGQVRVEGAEVDLAKPTGIDALRSHAGMVFQNDALFDALTVRENVAEPLRRRRISDAGIRITQALNDVGLLDAANKLPEQLSGGMRKRAGLARAFAMDPAVLLVDEPLAGLDPGTQKRIASLLAAARARGRALVIAVADPAPLWGLADSALALEDGRIVAHGKPDDVRRAAAPLLGAA